MPHPLLWDCPAVGRFAEAPNTLNTLLESSAQEIILHGATEVACFLLIFMQVGTTNLGQTRHPHSHSTCSVDEHYQFGEETVRFSGGKARNYHLCQHGGSEQGSETVPLCFLVSRLRPRWAAACFLSSLCPPLGAESFISSSSHYLGGECSLGNKVTLLARYRQTKCPA